MEELILEAKDLHTRFEMGKVSVEVIKGVSFKVYRGKTLGIVGESGCGKSVTVHSVMNLLASNGSITQGEVLYHTKDGRVIDLAKLKRYGKQMRSIRGSGIGMIFQDPMASLNPVYTVGDQIIENLRQHEKVSRAEARARACDMLKKLGIPAPEKRINDYPHQFSGGMKQRVMIAIAMVCNPQLLIADEPTTALDVTIQAQIMELMREIQQRDNKSIILITHNMGLVAEMAHHIAVMYMGRIVEYGTAQQIFESPLHPYTRALLKSVPVLGAGGMKRLYTIKGQTPAANEVTEGCEFGTRCENVCDACRKGAIPEYTDSEGHMARCIFAKEAAANG